MGLGTPPKQHARTGGTVWRRFAAAHRFCLISRRFRIVLRACETAHFCALFHGFSRALPGRRTDPVSETGQSRRKAVTQTLRPNAVTATVAGSPECGVKMFFLFEQLVLQRLLKSVSSFLLVPRAPELRPILIRGARHPLRDRKPTSRTS